MEVSRPRQNFHPECEEAINKQINMELYASYVYLSMGYYFERDDVCLTGFAQYFKRCSDEEQEHAQKFMKYQNMRGGRILFQAIAQPAQQEWGNGIDAIRSALGLEKSVNQSLLDMHALAMKNDDPQMCNFLETEYLKEQVVAVKELSDHITNLKLVEPGLGEYMFDKTFLKGYD